MAKRKVLISWSSGKDSAWAFYLLKKDPSIEVIGLVTTVNSEFDRIAMHAVRRDLLIEQAKSAGVPPWIVELPNPCSNEEYETIMGGVIERAQKARVSAFAFGDLFLEDIRQYREKQLAGTGIEPLFPLWMKDTAALAGEMQNAGVKAYVTSIDPKVLPGSFAGREWEGSFLKDLPQGVDPCGEKGEFHTFVFNGPMFSRSVPVRRGEVCARGGFVFADFILA